MSQAWDVSQRLMVYVTNALMVFVINQLNIYASRYVTWHFLYTLLSLLRFLTNFALSPLQTVRNCVDAKNIFMFIQFPTTIVQYERQFIIILRPACT